MEILDVLEGDNSIIVKTSEDNYEYNKLNSNTIKLNTSLEPEEVVTELRNRGYNIDSKGSKSVTLYAHDEANPHTKDSIADDLDVSRDHDIVEIIASITYEIEIGVEVDGDGNVFITSVFGHELNEHIKYD